ncbi:MAG: glycerol-3-phosphate 1-O-acyltransferase PlsY [Armatimonadetes bacterium]|nr:glycerol-3-phosphate 1-O-acyltransferase PlsY [Armatimonadota bacterium]
MPCPGTRTPRRSALILAALYLGSYLLGSVPFGLLVGLTKGIDLRQVGSGNIGATNVFRTLGKKAGLLAFALDVLKGVVPPVVARTALQGVVTDAQRADHVVLVGVVAVLGHTFSPFLKFKGGKGVATGFGALLGSAWIVGTAGFAAFVAVWFASGYVSLASITACLTVIASAYLTRQPPVFLAVYSIVPLLVIAKHAPNIRRLFKGEEPKTPWRSKPEALSNGADGPPPEAGFE